MADSGDVATVGGFNATAVDLTAVDPVDVICFLNAGENEYDGRLGVRISALFVILVTSTVATMFPVLATRSPRLKIPAAVYLFARYFGAGVIIATAFIHLLDPAYAEIGPNTCVGMTGGWAEYSWVPALALTSVMMTFLLDFGADWYVQRKYGVHYGHGDIEGTVVTGATGSDQDIDDNNARDKAVTGTNKKEESFTDSSSSISTEREFRQQIAAFLVLEFGVIFHSVIIGLNLAVAGDEFNTLYPVIVFHQAFEGLGIGARLSAIPFPSYYSIMPWLLCLAYGLTTPISIAVGLGLSSSLNPGSYSANVASGLLDSISAGILLYTGLVELLARDFLFNPHRTTSAKRVTFMLICLYLGIIIMALLGKWA